MTLSEALEVVGVDPDKGNGKWYEPLPALLTVVVKRVAYEAKFDPSLTLFRMAQSLEVAYDFFGHTDGTVTAYTSLTMDMGVVKL